MIVKNNIKKYKTKKGGFSAMGMDWAAQQKKQELEMKKKAEGEPDLGYVGAFSGMKCGNLTEVGDRLDCHHSKWKYDDPLAKMEVRRKALQRKRKGRHKFAIQRMCMEESPMLCATKDRDDLPKEKEPKCMEVNACPEPGSQLSDIVDDAKEFYKMMIQAFDFGKGKKGKRRKNTKELTKLRKKMKKELEQIKKDYDALKKPGAAKGGSMPQIDSNLSKEIFNQLSKSTTPIDNMMNGGSMPQINNNLASEIFNELSRSTTPIDYMMDGGSNKEEKEKKDAEKAKEKEEKKKAKAEEKEAKKKAKTEEKATKAKEKAQAKADKKDRTVFGKTAAEHSKDFKNKTGTSGCKNFVGKGVFAEDWKKYKTCVLDMMEGAPKDAAELIEGAKAKFKTAPLVDQHLQLLEKYKRKKDLMEKTSNSAAQKLKNLKKKAKGKIAAYKVAGQKAKDGAKKLTKLSERKTKKNMDKLENDPSLKEKAQKMAKSKADQKLADINAKRKKEGLDPLTKKDSDAFLKKQQSSEMKKIVSSKGAMKSIKKANRKEEMKKIANNLQAKTGQKINTASLKSSKKTLKRLKAAEKKIEKVAELKKANGTKLGDKAAAKMVLGSISARKGKTRAERRLAKSEAKKAVLNSGLGPMATSIKGVAKMTRAQGKIEKKLNKMGAKEGSKERLALEQGMMAKASTSFLQRKITKRSQYREATKASRQAKRDVKMNSSAKKALNTKGYFGKEGSAKADKRKGLFENTLKVAKGKREALQEAMKSGDAARIKAAKSDLKTAQKKLQTVKKQGRRGKRMNQFKRVGAAALTAGLSEKGVRKAIGKAASAATLGLSRKAQASYQRGVVNRREAYLKKQKEKLEDEKKKANPKDTKYYEQKITKAKERLEKSKALSKKYNRRNQALSKLRRQAVGSAASVATLGLSRRIQQYRARKVGTVTKERFKELKDKKKAYENALKSGNEKKAEAIKLNPKEAQQLKKAKLNQKVNKIKRRWKAGVTLGLSESKKARKIAGKALSAATFGLSRRIQQKFRGKSLIKDPKQYEELMEMKAKGKFKNNKNMLRELKKAKIDQKVRKSDERWKSRGRGLLRAGKAALSLGASEGLRYRRLKKKAADPNRTLTKSEQDSLASYEKFGKRVKRSVLAGLTLGGTEIKRAYNKSERFARSKLIDRELKQKRNQLKLETLKSGKAKNELAKTISEREKKIRNSKKRLNDITNEKFKKSQDTQKKQTKKLEDAKKKAENTSEIYKPVTEIQRDARAKRAIKKGKNTTQLEKDVKEQQIQGDKLTLKQQQNTRARAEKLLAARRLKSKDSASNILGDKKTTQQPAAKQTAANTQAADTQPAAAKQAQQSPQPIAKQPAAAAQPAATQASEAKQLNAATMAMMASQQGLQSATTSGATTSGATTSDPGTTTSDPGTTTSGATTNAREAATTSEPVTTNGATTSKTAKSDQSSDQVANNKPNASTRVRDPNQKLSGTEENLVKALSESPFLKSTK